MAARRAGSRLFSWPATIQRRSSWRLYARCVERWWWWWWWWGGGQWRGREIKIGPVAPPHRSLLPPLLLRQIISGFTDANYIEFTRFFKERAIPSKKPYVVAAEAMTPSVWFEPTEVRHARHCPLAAGVQTGALARAHARPRLTFSF